MPFTFPDNREVRDSCHLKRLSSLYNRFFAEFSHLTRIGQKSPVSPALMESESLLSDARLTDASHENVTNAPDVRLTDASHEKVFNTPDVTVSNASDERVTNAPDQKVTIGLDSTNEKLESELESAKMRLRENNVLVFQLKEEKSALGLLHLDCVVLLCLLLVCLFDNHCYDSTAELFANHWFYFTLIR